LLDDETIYNDQDRAELDFNVTLFCYIPALFYRGCSKPEGEGGVYVKTGLAPVVKTPTLRKPSSHIYFQHVMGGRKPNNIANTSFAEPVASSSFRSRSSAFQFCPFHFYRKSMRIGILRCLDYASRTKCGKIG